MHPNRATSTLFSNFLVIPTELTRSIRSHGHEKLTAVVKPTPSQRAGSDRRRTIDIPVAELPDKIALPPQAFFEAGYAAGDPMQFHYDGQQLNITRVSKSLSDQLDDCETDSAGVKVPPTWLIQAFTGAADTDDHIASGKRSADFYVDLYNRLCGDFSKVGRVLDFGCGCGRVLSYMPRNATTEYFGVDLREDAIDWMRATMPEGTFVTGTAMPPVDIGATDFDLIYAVSVFTHLTQEQEGAWLDEWHGLLRDGAYLMATFRGEDWVDQFAYEQQKGAIRKEWSENAGFCYQKHRYWEGIFPEFYSGTYHTIDYVRSVWGKRFEILEILPAAETPNEQNTAVMRKRA